MEPTARERYNQLTAQLWAFTLQRMKDLNLTLIAQSGIDEATTFGKDIYCKADYTQHLCNALRGLDEAEITAIVYNARDPMSRKLADWWEQHQQVDVQRIRATKTEIGQLVYEVTKLADDLPPALRDKIIGLTNEMHSVLSHQD